MASIAEVAKIARIAAFAATEGMRVTMVAGLGLKAQMVMFDCLTRG